MNSHLRRKARRLAARRWKKLQETLRECYAGLALVVPQHSLLLGRRGGMSEGNASVWLAVKYGKRCL